MPLRVTEALVSQAVRGAKTRDDGLALFNAGALRELGASPGGGQITAQAQGSGPKPYAVSIDLSQKQPVFQCTCPARPKPCKHAAALLIAFAREPQRFVQAASAKPKVTPKTESTIEQAPTSKARCRTCKGFIEEGAWRYAELQDYDEDYPDAPVNAFKYYHLKCAATSRATGFLRVLMGGRAPELSSREWYIVRAVVRQLHRNEVEVGAVRWLQIDAEHEMASAVFESGQRHGVVLRQSSKKWVLTFHATQDDAFATLPDALFKIAKPIDVPAPIAATTSPELRRKSQSKALTDLVGAIERYCRPKKMHAADREVVAEMVESGHYHLDALNDLEFELDAQGHVTALQVRRVKAKGVPLRGAFGKFQKLEILHIQAQRGTVKEVDAHFFDGFPALKNLSINCVKSAEPLLRLKGLQVLNLAGCSDLRWPKQEPHWGALEYLSLRGTKLKAVPPWVFKHATLKVLDVSENPLSALTGEWANLTLRRFAAEETKLTEFPAALLSMRSLEGLNFTGTALKELPEGLGQLTGLQEIYVSRTGLKQLPASMANLTKLEIIKASENRLTELPDLTKLKSLRELRLRKNQLRSIAPALKKQVTILSVEGNPL